jgi:hypothetical protein
MTSKDATGHNAGDPGSIESWLVSAGRDRRPGSPLNVPPCPASNFVLGERRAYARDDGTPGWEALEEIVGGLEGGSSVAFASGMAGIAAIFDQLPQARSWPAGRLLPGCRGTRQLANARPVDRAPRACGRHGTLGRAVRPGRPDLAGVAIESTVDGG